MTKKERLKILIAHYSGGNMSGFARLLGISPQAVASWSTRETFDIELIYSKCVNISAHWLLTGEGEILQSEEKITPVECNAVQQRDPRDIEIIELQSHRIKDLEKQVANKKDPFTGFESTTKQPSVKK